MCIAIVAKPGKRLTDEQVKNCWRNNSDGAGFAYISNGDLVIVKELKKVNRFLKLYKKHEELSSNSAMLIHFRVKTHGLVSIPNTQPIQISKRCAFIHNGVIHAMPNHAIHSDTVMFKNHVLRYLNDGFHNHQWVRDVIAKSTGFSKLAFLNVDGTYSIVNEKDGAWEQDIWYSNQSHKSWEVKKNRTSTPPHVVENVYRGGRCLAAKERREYSSPVQSSFPTVPERMLPASTAASTAMARGTGLNQIKVAEEKKMNQKHPYKVGDTCLGCKKQFFVSHRFYEFFNKYRVCGECAKDYEEVNMKPTGEGIITYSNYGDDDYYESFGGCV